MKGARNYFYTSLLLLVALLVGLFISEALLRMKGDLLTPQERQGQPYFSQYQKPLGVLHPHYYKFAPNEKYVQCKNEFCYERVSTVNGYAYGGFTQKPNRKKLLFLGDSFTEGVGARSDSSYPILLHKILIQEDSTIEVLNAGISGSDLVYEYKLFKDLLTAEKPDVLIVTVNASDLNEIGTRGGWERFQSDGTVEYKKAPWFENIYSQSHLVRLIVHNFLRYDNFLMPIKDLPVRDKLNNDILISAIDSFKNECQKHNIRLLMVFHPTRPEIKGPMKYEVRPLINHCVGEKINYVDLKPTIESLGIEKITKIYWYWDGHFNNQGYEILAKTVADTLRAKSLLVANKGI